MKRWQWQKALTSVWWLKDFGLAAAFKSVPWATYSMTAEEINNVADLEKLS